jgi:hypothetical protein
MNSWYVLYQRAAEIAVDREAEARRHHLARSAGEGGNGPATTAPGGRRDGRLTASPAAGPARTHSWTLRVPRLHITVTVDPEVR